MVHRGVRILKKLLIFALALSLLACDDDERDDALQVSVPVSVELIRPGSIEEFITNSATVEAIRSISIVSEVAGRYRLNINPDQRRYYRPGDRVKKGDVIIYLDNPEYENTIKIEAQELNLDISKREFEKQQSLYKKGGVTLRELKNAERAYIEAAYAYDNARIQLDKLKITAPFNGIIVSLPHYTTGTLLNAGTRMIDLMDYRALRGDVRFAAQDLLRIKVGQPVRVTYYNAPQDTLYGKITTVEPALDPESRSFGAGFEVQNPNLILRPGMLVKVDAIIARKDSAIVIPRDIVLSRREGKTVFIVEKGAAIRRTISTGLENSDFVEVINGLQLNERLVVKGFETLRNHSKIQVIN